MGWVFTSWDAQRNLPNSAGATPSSRGYSGNAIPALTATVTREEAGVAWLWVELSKAEGAVRALREGTGRVLIEQLRETPPPPKVDPEVVEDVTVKEVMPIGD